jgi:hypothetical protein
MLRPPFLGKLLDIFHDNLSRQEKQEGTAGRARGRSTLRPTV